jgi:predicted nucleic acid-binding protein
VSFLVDTCALSELTKPMVNPGLAMWFSEQSADALYVSALSVGELVKGIELLSPSKRRRELVAWLGELRSTFSSRIVGVDDAIAALWGQMAARAQRSGRSLGVVDGLLAATALHFGYGLVTRNAKDFKYTGAVIINPWT